MLLTNIILISSYLVSSRQHLRAASASLALEPGGGSLPNGPQDSAGPCSLRSLKYHTTFYVWGPARAGYTGTHRSLLDAEGARQLRPAQRGLPATSSILFMVSREDASTGPADAGPRSTLLVDKHATYIKSFSRLWDTPDKLEFVATEHFWMSGMYWGLSAMYLMGRLDDMDRDAILGWVLRCQHPNGGFGGSERNDPHLLYTLSAVQILALYDRLDDVDADKVAAYVASLQRPDGSFAGDAWGEIDTRFTYCALLCLSILGRTAAINVPAALDFIAKCKNFDGGFGCTPGNESHAGQVFTCIGALSLADALHLVDSDLFCWWLCERQTKSGGLNGRPEKLQDVCYSWWCLSCLSILGRLHWIDRSALTAFILDCQDEEDGGISDRPDDMADVYHTFFGIAGLSLMGYPDLAAIDPTWALPVEVVERIKRRNAAAAEAGGK